MSSMVPRLARWWDVRELGGEGTQMVKRLHMSGFPFHVPVPENSSLTGVIMVEQIKSINFRTRRAKRIECASDELLANVLSILDACIY